MDGYSILRHLNVTDSKLLINYIEREYKVTDIGDILKIAGGYEVLNSEGYKIINISDSDNLLREYDKLYRDNGIFKTSTNKMPYKIRHFVLQKVNQYGISFSRSALFILEKAGVIKQRMFLEPEVNAMNSSGEVKNEELLHKPFLQTAEVFPSFSFDNDIILLHWAMYADKMSKMMIDEDSDKRTELLDIRENIFNSYYVQMAVLFSDFVDMGDLDNVKSIKEKNKSKELYRQEFRRYAYLLDDALNGFFSSLKFNNSPYVNSIVIDTATKRILDEKDLESGTYFPDSQNYKVYLDEKIFLNNIGNMAVSNDEKSDAKIEINEDGFGSDNKFYYKGHSYVSEDELYNNLFKILETKKTL